MATIGKNIKKSLRRQKRIGIIAKATGLSRNEAKIKLSFAEGLAQIKVSQYMEEKLYLIPEDQLLNVRKKYLIEVVSEQFNLPFGETYAKMEHGREAFGISYFQFAEKQMLTCRNDEALAEEAKAIAEKHQGYVTKVCQATGWNEEKALGEMERVKDAFGIGPAKYYDEHLFLYTDAVIEEKKAKWREEKEADLKRVMNETGWSRREVQKHMSKCRIVYSIGASYYMIFKCWELTDEEIDSYARVKQSRLLSEKYNSGREELLNNKFLFDQTYRDYIQRKFWVNRDTDFEEFSIFVEGLTEIFCKPIDLSQGRGIEKIPVHGDRKALYDQLMDRERILVEECVVQHQQMEEMFPGCVNTVRLVTLQKDNVCHRICAFVRFGCYGVTDNFGSGGVLAAVDVDTGRVITPAIDKTGKTHQVHPITGKSIVDFVVPNWDMVKSVTEAALRSQETINYVGWDVAICQDKAVLIEGNAISDLGAYQATFADKKEGKKYLVDPYL